MSQAKGSGGRATPELRFPIGRMQLESIMLKVLAATALSFGAVIGIVATLTTMFVALPASCEQSAGALLAREPSNHVPLVVIGVLWLLCVVGSVVLGIRYAARDSEGRGRQAVRVIAASLLAFGVAAFGGMVGPYFGLASPINLLECKIDHTPFQLLVSGAFSLLAGGLILVLEKVSRSASSPAA